MKALYLLLLLPLMGQASSKFDLTCIEEWVPKPLLIPWYLQSYRQNFVGNTTSYTIYPYGRRVYNDQEMTDVRITRGEIRFNSVDRDEESVTWEHLIDRHTGLMFVNMKGDGVRYRYRCERTDPKF